jgi:hypothetical protein
LAQGEGVVDASSHDPLSHAESPLPPAGRTLAEIGHEWAETDNRLRDKENEKRRVMSDYNDEIGKLDSRCAELAAEYRAAEFPETYDYKHGVKHVWDGRTRTILRTERLAPETPIEAAAKGERIENKPITVAPPKETFSQLQDGKLWEHDEHGVCRVLAVLEDSVRVHTEDLDEADEGIEIGRADWNAHNAYPREMTELELSSYWRVLDRPCIVTASDDEAACVTWLDNSSDGRVSRLTFAGETAKRVQLPDVGKRVWLDNKGMIGEGDGAQSAVVTVDGPEVDGHVPCTQSWDGQQAQIELSRLMAGEVLMDAPARKGKRAKKGNGAAEPAATEA